ncbi:MAG: nucleotidyltransferase domain-containing protein [Bacteroidota bacterium]
MTAQERDSAIAEIVQRLRVEYQPERIILFGSSAEDTPTMDSDVDLLIVKRTRERFIDRWTAVRRILSDPTRRFGLDTIVLNPEEIRDRLANGDQFLEHILQHGRVMYEA